MQLSISSRGTYIRVKKSYKQCGLIAALSYRAHSLLILVLSSYYTYRRLVLSCLGTMFEELMRWHIVKIYFNYSKSNIEVRCPLRSTISPFSRELLAGRGGHFSVGYLKQHVPGCQSLAGYSLSNTFSGFVHTDFGIWGVQAVLGARCWVPVHRYSIVTQIGLASYLKEEIPKMSLFNPLVVPKKLAPVCRLCTILSSNIYSCTFVDRPHAN